jgi:hypothetical protein
LETGDVALAAASNLEGKDRRSEVREFNAAYKKAYIAGFNRLTAPLKVFSDKVSAFVRGTSGASAYERSKAAFPDDGKGGNPLTAGIVDETPSASGQLFIFGASELSPSGAQAAAAPRTARAKLPVYQVEDLPKVSSTASVPKANPPVYNVEDLPKVAPPRTTIDATGKSIPTDRLGVPDGSFTPKAGVAPYVRPRAAGPTAPQTASVQAHPCAGCGAIAPKMVADHIDPLVVEHYRTGTIDTAAQSSLAAVQPHCPTCSSKQGGALSGFSKAMKKKANP